MAALGQEVADGEVDFKCPNRPLSDPKPYVFVAFSPLMHPQPSDLYED